MLTVVRNAARAAVLVVLLALVGLPAAAVPATAAVQAGSAQSATVATKDAHPPIHPKTLTKRTKKFMYRWGKAINHHRWHWLRSRLNPRDNLKRLKVYSRYYVVHWANNCDPYFKKSDRECFFREMTVYVHRRPDGSLWVHNYAVYG